ncbi:MAG TPA: Smr/MutS family protein [Balneolaceae bacterium]|nr:Smr/MutS family protein [Balneolaceae bacterium]
METVFTNTHLFEFLTSMDSDEPHKIPINGVLDLHYFAPEDLSTLIDEYINACLEEEIYQVRFIHGKGIGNIRRSVHALLERNPHVTGYQLADGSGGGWGATIANLRRET